MMNAILGDVWIYVCLAGLLLSGAALPFLIKRYRAEPAVGPGGLSPSEDAEEPPENLSVEPVKVVDASTFTEPPKKSSTASMAKPSPVDPKMLKTGQTMPGGISPAIVYLQNLKLQIEHFEKEIHGLRSQVSGFAKTHDQQFHDLLDRMGEMQKELHLQVVEHETQAKPAPAKAKVEPAAKPSAVHAPVPAAKPVPAKTKVEPGSAAAGGAAPKPALKPAPVPAKAKVELGSAAAGGAVAAAKPSPKPAPKPAAKPAVELKPAVDPEPTVPVAEKKEPGKSTAEEIANTLTLNAPSGSSEKPEKKEEAAPPKEEAAPPKEEDILKPEKGKGPVWPV